MLWMMRSWSSRTRAHPLACFVVTRWVGGGVAPSNAQTSLAGGDSVATNNAGGVPARTSPIGY